MAILWSYFKCILRIICHFSFSSFSICLLISLGFLCFGINFVRSVFNSLFITLCRVLLGMHRESGRISFVWNVCLAMLFFLQLVYCLFVDQKEPTSDASTPSSPRLAPPTKRTRRELTSEPSSSDTSPSPQAKGQRVSWDIPTYCTRSVIDKRLIL